MRRPVIQSRLRGCDTESRYRLNVIDDAEVQYMAKYMIRVEREMDEETQRENPNLDPTIWPNLAPFTWPTDLTTYTDEQVKNIIEATIQELPPDEIQYQRDTLEETETVSVVKYEDGGGEVFRGEVEIPDWLQTLTAASEVAASAD